MGSPAPPPPTQAPVRRPNGWLWWAAVPVMGVWVPLVAGVRAGHRSWVSFGVVLCALTAVAMALPQADDGELSGVATALAVAGWVGALGWTLAHRDTYAIRADARRGTAARDLQFDLRDEERLRARRLAAADPGAALRRGVGRPDVPGAAHGWLVDVNHAPAGVLASLPGVDDDAARRIVATREEVGLFSSVDDMVFVLDLPPGRVEALRGVAVAIRG